MASPNVSPTKSNLLALRRQLSFAQEGYDLLDQKRQILVFELMSRIGRAREMEQRVEETLLRAHSALREALLDLGSLGVDRVSLAASARPQVIVNRQILMGLQLPRVTAQREPMGAPPYGLAGASASTDTALLCFVEALPLIAELAALQNAVIRLAHELTKTQRRCNALSKTFIPAHQEAIAYIAGALEERDREFTTILKLIRGRRRGCRT